MHSENMLCMLDNVYMNLHHFLIERNMQYKSGGDQRWHQDQSSSGATPEVSFSHLCLLFSFQDSPGHLLAPAQERFPH